MKQLTSLVLLLFCATLFAQHDMASVEGAVLNFTNKLEARSIDTFFTTTRYCTGETQLFELPNGRRCFSQGTYVETYVIWQENEETMMKKIDNCGLFTSVVLPDNQLYDFFKKNVSSLQNNKVKPYEIAGAAGGPIQRTEVEDCHRKYQFVEKTRKALQAFTPFDLTNGAREKNINYEYNQKLKVTALESMVDKAIKFVTSNPSFKRL